MRRARLGNGGSTHAASARSNARNDPPPGVLPDDAVAEVRNVLESIGDTCPECRRLPTNVAGAIPKAAPIVPPLPCGLRESVKRRRRRSRRRVAPPGSRQQQKFHSRIRFYEKKTFQGFDFSRIRSLKDSSSRIQIPKDSISKDSSFQGVVGHPRPDLLARHGAAARSAPARTAGCGGLRLAPRPPAAVASRAARREAATSPTM